MDDTTPGQHAAPLVPALPGAEPSRQLSDLVEALERSLPPQNAQPRECSLLYMGEAAVRTLPGVKMGINSAQAVWLSVKPLDPSLPPPVPAVLHGRLESDVDECSEPRMRVDALRNCAADQADGEFQAYVSAWLDWAVRERSIRSSMVLHESLMQLRRTMAADSGRIKVVWGFGLIAAGPLASAAGAALPLVEKVVELTVEPDGSVQVRPCNADLRLNERVAQAMDGAAANKLLDHARALLNQKGMDLVAAASLIADFVRRGNCGALPTVLPAAQQTLQDGWALFTIEQDGRILYNDLRRLQAVAGHCACPSWTPYVDHERGATPRDDSGHVIDNPGTATSAVLAVTSREHGAQAAALAMSRALSQGRTVLVSARDENWLAAVESMLGAEVRPLVVSVATDETSGVDDFNHALERIDNELGRQDLPQAQNRLRQLQSRAEETRTAISRLDEQMQALVQAHVQRFTLLGREYTVAELAGFVVAQEAAFSWMEPVAWENSADETIEEELLQRVAQAREHLGQHLGESLRPVNRQDCPELHELLRLHEALCELDATARLVAAAPIKASLRRDATAGELARFIDTLRQALSRLQAMRGGWEHCDWAGKVLALFADPDANEQATLLRDALGALKNILRERRVFSNRRVRLPQVEPTQRDLFAQAIAMLAQGKNPFAWYHWRLRAVRPLVAKISIELAQPANKEDWLHVATYLSHQEKLVNVVAQWNTIASETGIPVIDGPRDLKLAVEIHYRGKALLKAWQEIKVLLDPAQPRCFEAEAAQWLDPAVWEEWIAYASLCQKLLELSAARYRRDAIVQWAQSQPNASREAIEQFALEVLGRQETSDSLLQQRWLQCLQDMRECDSLHQADVVVQEASTALAQAGAPQWAQRLRTAPVGQDPDPWVAQDWRQAWAWSRARDLIGRIDAGGELLRLQQQRRVLRTDLASTEAAIAEPVAMLHLERSTSAQIRSAIETYLNSIRMLGTGAGVRAMHHRHQSQQAMSVASKAVRGWIMPSWRVSQLLPAEVAAYDLVILDAAMDSDLHVLPCLLRGRHVMVVNAESDIVQQPDDVTQTAGASRLQRLVQVLPRLHLYPGPDVAAPGSTPELSVLLQRCRNWFEREMLQALASMGYSVDVRVDIAQAGPLLVAGNPGGARMAIVCEGAHDEAQQPWTLDHGVQLQLERSGWSLWRCLAATFKMQGARCLADLVRTLDAAGIVPVTAKHAQYGTILSPEETPEIENSDCVMV